MSYVYGSGVPDDYHNYSRTLSPQSVWDNADVGLFGDSISQGAYPQLNTRLVAAGHTLAVDAWASRPTAPAVEELERRAYNGDSLPRLTLMAAGTNDIFDPPVMAALIQRAQAACAYAGSKLVWVDTFARREGFREADLMNCAWVNEQIHAVMTPATIVHWYRLFASKKSRIADRLRDGVHPIDGQGDDFWAAAIMEVILPLL